MHVFDINPCCCPAQLEVLLPPGYSSLAVEISFFSFCIPFFHEGLEEAFGLSEEPSLFCFQGRIGVDFICIGYGSFKEAPAHLLLFGRDNAGHVRIFGHDDLTTFIMLYYKALTNSALDGAIEKGYAFHKGEMV